jgi:hypothetical protein
MEYICGGFTLSISPEKLAVHFWLIGTVDYSP